MALSYIDTLRNSMMDEVTTAIGTSGFLRIYDGTPPADADTALSGNTMLAELNLSSSFAAAASGGVLTANSISDETSAAATGNATFFRLVTSGGAAVVQGSVGTSGADLNIQTVSIVSGATVSVSSFAITEGNA